MSLCLLDFLSVYIMVTICRYMLLILVIVNFFFFCRLKYLYCYLIKKELTVDYNISVIIL